MDNSIFNLNIAKTETAPCSVALKVEVLPASVQKTFGEVIAQFSKQVRIPGFRAGKVPTAVIQKRFGSDVVNEVKNRLISAAYQEAAKRENLKVMSDPEIVSSDDVTFNQTTAFNVEFAVETRPAFELPEYKGLPMTKKNIVVKDEAVEKVLEEGRERYTTYEKVDGAAAENDMLRADYKGVVPEGTEVTDKSKYLLEANGTWLVLRAPEMLPGVTASLVGAKAGDERDAQITFPEDHYNKELAGKTLTYHIVVKEVHKAQVPAMDDEFAKKVGAPSMEELRKRIADNLKNQAENGENARLSKEIMERFETMGEFVLPPKALEREKNAIAGRKYQSELQKGAKKEDLEGKKDEMLAEATAEAEKHLHSRIVMDAIIEKENIAATPEDMNRTLYTLASMYGTTPDKLIKQLRENDQMHMVYGMTLDQNLVKFIIDNAQMTTVEE